MGLNEEAVAEAEAAWRSTGEPEAQFSLAGAYENMGRLDKAVEHMQLASDYADARQERTDGHCALPAGVLLQQFSSWGRRRSRRRQNNPFDRRRDVVRSLSPAMNRRRSSGAR